MRVESFYVEMGPAERVTARILTQPGEVLGYLTQPGANTIKARIEPGLYSIAQAVAGIRTFDKLIPVFAGLGRGVYIRIENPGSASNYWLECVFYREEEIRDFLANNPRLHIQPCQYFNASAMTGLEYILFTNTRKEKIFLCAVLGDLVGTSEVAAEFVVGNERVAYVVWEPLIGGIQPQMIPIEKWLYPKQEVKVRIKQGDPTAKIRFHFLLAFAEISVEQIPPFNLDLPGRPAQMGSADPHVVKAAALSPELPPPLPKRARAYPVTGLDEYRLVPSVPKPISLRSTSLLKAPGQAGPSKIEGPGESRSVEALLSPFGLVRKAADTMGRVRMSGAAVSYNAGKVEATSSTAQNIYIGYGSRAVSLYAKQLKWEIKILPVYDWLSGKDIDDMDTIYLDQGQTLTVDIEARQVQVSCPSASASTKGVIYYVIEK